MYLGNPVEIIPLEFVTPSSLQTAIADVVTDLSSSAGSGSIGYLPAVGGVATDVQTRLRLHDTQIAAAVSGGSGNSISSVSSNMEVLTTSQVWVVPAGVTSAKITLVGGGQGGASYALGGNTIYMGGSSGYVTTAYLSGLIQGTECIATIGTGGSANSQFGGYTSLTSNSDLSIDFIAGGGNGVQSSKPGQFELGSNRGEYSIQEPGMTAVRTNGASAPGFGNFKYGSGGMGYPFVTVPDNGESGVIIIEYMFASSSNSSGGGATGGGTDDVFYENSTIVTTSYTISSNKNAMSAGPITMADGVTVTVPNSSVWSVI